jgi:hypothetical protein
MSIDINSKHAEECLSPSEFAQRAGLNISTVHRYIKRGKLAKIQLGGEGCRIWIPASELYRITGSPPSQPLATSQSAQEREGNVAPSSIPGRTPAWMKCKPFP